MSVKIQDKMLVLGLMSGTSLDGLDLALCTFVGIEGKYSYKIIAAKTVEYSSVWKKRLSEVKGSAAEDYFTLDVVYANYVADEINLFLKAAQMKPELIASQGHTVFHQPKKGFTTQLGSGAIIAAHTQITTVCDFRSLDVALGGQGAPLVPIGDALLFGNYEACLNIGGIANISFVKDGKRMAYDVCEANMLLNLLAERAGKSFDKGGVMARSGIVDEKLLAKMNGQEYYAQKGAKSMGREWFEINIQDLLDNKQNINDLLATATEHIATIIAQELNHHDLKNVLISGGGAFNSFLIETLRSKTKCEIIVPKDEIINFKEAVIFAFLGFLRIHQKTNTLKSVTGALKDSVGGAVYLG